MNFFPRPRGDGRRLTEKTPVPREVTDVLFPHSFQRPSHHRRNENQNNERPSISSRTIAATTLPDVYSSPRIPVGISPSRPSTSTTGLAASANLDSVIEMLNGVQLNVTQLQGAQTQGRGRSQAGEQALGSSRGRSSSTGEFSGSKNRPRSPYRTARLVSRSMHTSRRK